MSQKEVTRKGCFQVRGVTSMKKLNEYARKERHNTEHLRSESRIWKIVDLSRYRIDLYWPSFGKQWHTFWVFFNTSFKYKFVSGTIFLLHEEPPLIFLESRWVGNEFPHSLFVWKRLYFPFIKKKKIFHWILNYGLRFSFWHFKYVTVLSFSLHGFWSLL